MLRMQVIQQPTIAGKTVINLLGLKIQWALRPCEFDSRLRHQAQRALRAVWAPFLLARMEDEMA